MTDAAVHLDQATRFLRQWAALYRNYELTCTDPSDWQPAMDLLTSAKAVEEKDGKQLTALLKKSDPSFSPLADPLNVDFNTHRWLAAEREEAYSDWLAWLLEQIGDARHLLKFLNYDEQEVQRCAHEKFVVKREVVITNRRLDVVVYFGNEPVLLVECKTKWFDENSVRGQLHDYAKWAKDHPTLKRCFFLAVEVGNFECPDGFEFLSWRQISLRVRALVREWMHSYPKHVTCDRSLIVCAMALAFCGAVEQNLLGLSMKPQIFMAHTTAEYLREWLSGNGGRSYGSDR